MLLAFRSTPHLSLGIRQTPNLSKDKGFLGTVFYFCHAVLPYASTSSPLPCTSPSPGLGTFKLVAKIKRWHTPFGPRRRGRAWLGPQRLGTRAPKGKAKVGDVLGHRHLHTQCRAVLHSQRKHQGTLPGAEGPMPLTMGTTCSTSRLVPKKRR